MKVQVTGTEKVIANLANLERMLTKGASVALQETILEVAAKAKRDAPIDLGGLRQSINTEYSSVQLEGKISANAPYAPYVEFGTGGMVEIPQGFEEMASAYKGNGKRQVNLPARPFLIPAAKEGAKKLEAKLLKLVQ